VALSAERYLLFLTLLKFPLAAPKSPFEDGSVEGTIPRGLISQCSHTPAGQEKPQLWKMLLSAMLYVSLVLFLFSCSRPST